MAVGWRGQYYRYREMSLNFLAVYRQRSDWQAFLEIILSLSTLIVFFSFALKPTALTMISLYREINEKRNTLASLNQKITDLQTANSIFIENQTLVPIVDNAIFTLPKPDIFSKQILGLAQKNSVEISGLSIGEITLLGPNTVAQIKDELEIKPLPNGAQAMSTAITIKGTYSNTLGFINDVENLRIPIQVDNVTISSSLTEKNTVTGLITGRIPFIGQN